MDKQVKDMMALLMGMKETMEAGQNQLDTRLKALETAKEEQPEGSEVKDSKSFPTGKVEITQGRERPLTKTFGVDTSADALLEFLDHYQLCVAINTEKGIPGWDRPDYRAKELRCQLVGEAATYIRQEEVMLEDWVKDDREIIKRMRDRWVNRDCIELDIIEFEEARQSETETLAQYMTRLKGLGQRAFGEFDPRGMQQRIIWRFLDGVKDRDVRASIIRERWMKDRKQPKSYDEVLKIGENALMVKVASRATGALGSSSGSSGTSSKSPGTVSSMRQTPGQNSKKGKGSVKGHSGQRTPRLFECFYCGERHTGGWMVCEKRKRDNPSWTPSHRGSGYNSGASAPTSPDSTRRSSPTGSNGSVNQSF